MTLVTVSDKVHRYALVKLAGKVNLPEFANLPYPEQIHNAMQWDFMCLTGLALLSDAGRDVATTVLSGRLYRLWEKHFKHVLRFHELMLHCRTVLIGSAALHFLQPCTDCLPDNFDFCTPNDQYDTFRKFLLNDEGAIVLARDLSAGSQCSPDVYASSGVKESTSVRLPSGLIINIYRSPSISPLHGIPASVGTHLVNYISAECLSVAYPLGLDARQAYYEASSSTADVGAIKRKYERRGFYFLEPPTPSAYNCLADGYCARAIRFFGDEHCVAIRFASNRRAELLRVVPPSSQERFNVFTWTIAWVRGGRPCGNDWCRDVILYSAHPVILTSATSLC